MSERRRLVRLLREGSRPRPRPASFPSLATAGLDAGSIRAVLFDIYGTLLVSASGDIGSEAAAPLQDALASLLGRYDVVMPPQTLLRRRVEEIRRSHARQAEVDHPEVRIERIWRAVLGPRTALSRRSLRRFAVEFEMLSNPVWPMPGARQLIDSLRARGLRLGLISNAQFFTPLLFEAFWGLTDWRLGFERGLRLYSYRLGRAKPCPRLFEIARGRLRRSGIAAEETLFVGNDMLNDVLAASRAGFQTCLFAGDRRSLRLRQDDPRCAGLAPGAVVASLEDLRDLLRPA